jgi:hypothetical protein
MNLGGLVTGTLIAGVLVGPLAVHISFGTTGGSEPTGYSPIELTRLNVQAEARYLSDARTGTLLSTRPETSPVTSRWRNYPDGIRLGWKEVEADEPLGNPPTAS